jgi:hypothetical protein
MMIKCPMCGSSAQVTFVWSDQDMYDTKTEREYICGCGCLFNVLFKAVEIKPVGRVKE